jgi:hypothetical protein
VSGWRLATWGRRSGWNERHRLALASGALGCFLVVLDPIFEVTGSGGARSTHGTVLVALAYLIFLIVLTRRVADRFRTAAPARQSAGAG